MINFFKKILYKKKLVVFTMIFLSAIFTILILKPIKVFAYDEIVQPYKEIDFDIENVNAPVIIEYHQNVLNDFYSNTDNYLTGNYDSYVVYFEKVYPAIRKLHIVLYNSDEVEFRYRFSVYSGSYNNSSFELMKKGVTSHSNRQEFDVRHIVYNETSLEFDEIQIQKIFGINIKWDGNSYSDYHLDVTRNIYYKSNRHVVFRYYDDEVYSTTDYKSIKLNKTGIIYNDGDFIFTKDMKSFKPGMIEYDEEDWLIRRLYNFQIDLTKPNHLNYNHTFQILYSLYNKSFENLFKNFEFIGLVNNDGLYHWEKTDTCYVDIYSVTTSYNFFNININNIEGNCLDYYDRVKLIVNLDNAYLRGVKDIFIKTNSSMYLNFLSHTSVVDILSNYKYVNFTTNKNDVKFNIMVRDVEGSDFYKRHFFKYFDKTNLKTTSEYVRVFSEPFPLFGYMYTTRDIVLNKNIGLTVFTHEVVDNEIFMFEYQDVYYSFTNNNVNSDVPIIDEDGTRQEVDIDTEFPEPPAEEIVNINDGVNLLKDGIKAVHILYSTFYNNLTIEFKILHNVFYTMLLLLIVVKVVLK